jgi:membrane protein YdbS with pleckstrin-like domain
MSYIEQSLASNEQLVYRAHFHWLYRFAAWALLLASAIAALVLLEQDHPTWTGAALIGGGVVLFLAIMVPIWAEQIAVTNQRLIHRRGLVRRSTEELQLSAVEEVRLEQGLLGRLLGFGRVVVSGTGIEDVRLPALAEPVRLRRKLQEAMSSAHRPLAA